MPASRRTRATFLTLVALVALVAGACTEVADAPVPANGTQATLTVMLADDWASADAVVDAIADFEESRDVHVVVRPVRFSQLEEFMIFDREGPQDVDVSQWHAFAAGALGWTRPVTERFASEFDEDTFVPGAMEDVTWDGEVHGVPLDVNAMVMLVNTDLLAEYGHTLDDLRTWDGLRAVAASAADDGVMLTHLPASTWSLFSWLRGNGGRWFTRDADTGTELLFDSPEVRETFQFLAGLTDPEAPRAVPADAIDTDAGAYPLFVDQQTMLLATGTWDVARLIEEDRDFGWTVVPMPVGPSGEGPGTVLGGSSLYVTEQADDVALAWDFMTHVIQPQYALRYAKEDGRLPGRTDVLSDPFFRDDERYRVAVEQLPYASAMQLIVYPRILDAATGVIFDVLHHEDEVGPAFQELQKAAEAMVSEEQAES